MSANALAYHVYLKMIKKNYSEIIKKNISLLVIDDQEKVQTLTIDTDLQPTVLQGDLIGW